MERTCPFFDGTGGRFGTHWNPACVSGALLFYSTLGGNARLGESAIGISLRVGSYATGVGSTSTETGYRYAGSTFGLGSPMNETGQSAT